MPAAATAAARSAASAAKPDICGFCSVGVHPVGKHPHCPRAIRNGVNAPNKIITCECPVDGCGDQVLRCLDCKTEEEGAIDPADWSCFDRSECRARIQARMDSNPLIQQLREVRSTAMARVANEKAEKAEKKAATPKTGNCVHCGEPTKGGKFLPGHDAAYVSTLVQDALATPGNEAKNRQRAVDASEALGKKFDKSIGLAKDKVAKAEKAKAEKAAAQEKAKADKAAAKASKATQASASKEQAATKA